VANIDFHVHVTPPDIIVDFLKYGEKEPYFSLLSQSKNNKFATAEDVIAALEKDRTFDKASFEKASFEKASFEKASFEKASFEKASFEKAVVFGFAFRDIGLCRYVNDYVIEKVRQYPQKLIGFMVVPPRDAQAAKEIERCHSAGLKGVGELFPAGQDFDPSNKKETMAVTGACMELGLPLLFHANEPVGHYYPGKTDVNLRQLEKFVENNSSLKIVLAHFGGGLLFYESMNEVREKFCNVYYDTAAFPFLYNSRIFSVIKSLDLCGKILFGSDFPLLPHSRYLPAFDESGLTAEEKDMILGENAQKLLG